MTTIKKCGYGQRYDHCGKKLLTNASGAESLIAMQSTVNGVAVNSINSSSFDALAINLPSQYSKPTIKGLVTRVPTGFALISNITFGSKTIQFMAVDGTYLTVNQTASPGYMSTRINSRIIKPVILPNLNNLSKNQKTMIDAYASSIWFAMFMWEIFGRAGIFDTSHVYLSVANVRMENAFWNGYYMVYGTGFGTMDIVGHETGHGIIQASGGLEYEGESGALNESIADIIGVCFEKYYDIRSKKNLFDWTVGEDVFSGGFRSFSNPKSKRQPDTYMGKFWESTTDPSEYNDYGGVHTNSGVNNFFFYRVVNGTRGLVRNEKRVSYNIVTPFPMFHLMKLIYLSMKGIDGYLKIGPLSTYAQYASAVVQNTPLFLQQHPTLPETLQTSVTEGFIGVGILIRGSPLPVLGAKDSTKKAKVSTVAKKSSTVFLAIFVGFFILVMLFLFSNIRMYNYPISFNRF